uniref:ATP-dependent bile acid transporter n=1 Tax=Kwoniella dejecticola CBS 10117 TaxID=1296121 RepID=A0A1A6A4B4_9TREE|nr:uncharacterized protein I303_04216 [Kwoniella dejecticola CBS 10117]OBR84894.1 hypothetical protein I303_04216 [Kwoniella dejecticola CBS 10117]
MSSTQTPSETDTLLPSQTLSPEIEPEADDDGLRDRDRPVLLDQFLRNVRIGKALLAPGLIGSLALEITHLIMASKEGRTGHNDLGDKTKNAAWALDIFGAISLSLLFLLYTFTILKPIKIRTITLSPLPEISNLRIHRFLCVSNFLILLLLNIVHPLPGIWYTIKTHNSPPKLSIRDSTIVYYLRTGFLCWTFLIGGMLRRGPKLYFKPPKLGTGFGVNESKHDQQSDSGVRIKLIPAPEEEETHVPLSGITIDSTENDYSSSGFSNGEEESNVLDYDNSSMLSFIFLGYIGNLAYRSMQVESLAQSDLPLLEEKTRNSGIRETVFSSDNKDVEIVHSNTVTGWALVKSMWRGKGRAVLITFVLEAIRNLISFIQIAAVHEIIESFKEPEGSDKSYAYLMCWGLFAGQAFEVLLAAYLCVRENYLLHIPIRMNLSSMLLAKILRTTDAKALEAHNVKDGDKADLNKGRSQVMNLMTIDTGTIASMATHLWNFANGMVTLVIGVGMLYGMLGISALVGIACIPLSTPLSYLVSKLIYRCDKEWARARDARTGAMKEFLMGIKVIKLNAFEPYFISKVRRLREHEVSWQRWRYHLGTSFNILAEQLPVVALLVMFWFHTKVLHRPLDPATAFVALNLFYRVKDGISTFPGIIQAFLSAKVSVDRICRFLSQPETDQYRWDNASHQIICNRATVTWPSADVEAEDAGEVERFSLHDLHFDIPIGGLTLLCGPLGSGKTLMLRAFLGEATVKQGSVVAPRSLPDSTPVYPKSRRFTINEWLTDSIAYAPQQSFIRHGSVRDNILFGQPMWKERYREALRQAALLPDLAMFDESDMTEVGEHGVTLSGGQKARVNLARCLYSPAKTVYLDDILSAVDAHTAQYICNECLGGSLLRDRTVVLVSHHVSLVLPTAHYVISLNKDGRVDQACLARDFSYTDLAEVDPVDSSINESSVDESGVTRATTRSRRKSVKYEEREESNIVTRQLYREEHKSVGRVSSSHYWLVFSSAGGVWYWASLLLLYGIHRAVTIERTFWLEKWTSDPDESNINHYLVTYAFLSVGAILLGSFKWVWLYGLGNLGFYNRGSKKIHEMILTKVFQAPLQFFETTPQGRLLNIFGQDMYRLDCQSADGFGRLGLITAAVVVFIKTPVISLVALVWGVPFYWISNQLNKLRADIRRLTASASSPLYSLYNDAIDGVVMVRAFGQNKLMMHAMKVINNRERVTWFAAWAVYNWVRAVIRSFASVVVAATGFALIQQDLTAAQAGLILNFALVVSTANQSLSVSTFPLSSCIHSFEPSTDITMPDAEPEEGITPDRSWPAQGEIRVHDLKVRYAPDLPEVLKGVSFHVKPGRRVGLVGATGSGKSTLALSLFRAIEPHGGSITIDGIDIGTIALPELRKRLNMVAQDGMLCSGTLRDALDVTGLRDDYEIYEALRRVHLLSDSLTKDEMESNPFADLETFVAIEGANFSQGQRQLLCLARALLKRSKILVMDEATSSVDFEMDAKITATIKECFSDTTMLVIAHRLATIMQYDAVLVLDQGQIVESGEPLKLMEDPTTMFHGMCMAQGEEEFNHLLSIARS